MFSLSLCGSPGSSHSPNHLFPLNVLQDWTWVWTVTTCTVSNSTLASVKALMSVNIEFVTIRQRYKKNTHHHLLCCLSVPPSGANAGYKPCFGRRQRECGKLQIVSRFAQAYKSCIYRLIWLWKWYFSRFCGSKTFSRAGFKTRSVAECHQSVAAVTRERQPQLSACEVRDYIVSIVRDSTAGKNVWQPQNILSITSKAPSDESLFKERNKGLNSLKLHPSGL